MAAATVMASPAPFPSRTESLPSAGHGAGLINNFIAILADGWIPSLGYMPVEEIPAMRRRIDAAAEAAGRRPDEIRGILNLSIRIDPDAEPQPDAVTGSSSLPAKPRSTARNSGGSRPHRRMRG